MKSDKDKRVIRYAGDKDRQQLYALWKSCFHDTDAFMDYYFDYYLKSNRVLMLCDEHALKAMIHLNPYQLQINKKRVHSYYVVGVATDAAFRHQGAMTQLMKKVFEDCYMGGIPMIYLMPADEAIYTPFQFAYIYNQYVEKKHTHLRTKLSFFDTPLTDFIVATPVTSNEERAHIADWANTTLQKQYDCFTWRDAWYYERLQQENIVDGGNLLSLTVDQHWIGYLSYACEEKIEIREIGCLPEWQPIVADWLMQNFDGQDGEMIPLCGEAFLTQKQCEKAWQRPMIMGRVIDLVQWMTCLPVSEQPFSMILQINDQWIAANNGSWFWKTENGRMTFERTHAQWDISLDIDTLIQWLMEYQTAAQLLTSNRITYSAALSEEKCFEMLQKVPVLHGCAINEIV